MAGHAIAGGCLLAMASDYRYGIHGFHRMGLNEMAIGIDLPPDMLSIISNTISKNHLLKLQLNAECILQLKLWKKVL